MRPSVTAGATVAVVALVALSMVIFNLSLTRAALLAPVMVACAGAIAFLAIVWTKAARSSLAKPSDARRSVREPDGLENSSLSSRSGEDARGGDRP